jgi:aminoacylase
LGVPAIGISPMEHTKVLLHDHNEYLNEKVFLRGIQWYEKTIMALANVASEAEKQAGKLLIQA